MGGKSSKGKKSKGQSDSEEQATSITFDGNGTTVETKSKASLDATIKEEKKQLKQSKKGAKKNASPEEEKRKEEAGKKLRQAQKSKGIASRLGGNLGIDLDAEEKKKSERSKMFTAPKGPEHSKIYNALNPQKLYYESRREKEEAEEEKEVLEFSSKDYGFRMDESGNVMEADDDDDEEEDDNFDPNNLPDFGEFQKVMDERKAAREEKQKEHQAKLKAQWDAKKKAEEEARNAEVAKIKEREKKLKAQKEMHKDGFVEEAQARVAAETEGVFKKFSFH